MKTILVTGFEPFDGGDRNPSADAALALDGRSIAGHAVVGAVLPCVFDTSLRELRKLLRQHQPALVLCLGLAAGRAAISIERVAINVDDARIPDNAGAQPVDRPIIRGGPVGYWSTLPVRRIVTALRERGFPVEVSSTAGTFVCNHVFYGLLHTLRRRPGTRGGFVHLPSSPDQAPAGQPAMPLDTMLKAVTLLLEVAARRLPGGLQA